jgi:hypothetical protein
MRWGRLFSERHSRALVTQKRPRGEIRRMQRWSSSAGMLKRWRLLTISRETLQ